MDGVSVLSLDEAQAIRGNLIEGLHAFFDGADQLISLTNARKAEAVIWGTIDDEDCGFFADAFLRVAMKSEAAAWAVRGIAEMSPLMRAGTIVLPRAWQTMKFYADNGGLVMPL